MPQGVSSFLLQALIAVTASLLILTPYRIGFIGKYGQRVGQRIFVLVATTAISGSIFGASCLAIYGTDTRGFEWIVTTGSVAGMVFGLCVFILLVFGLLLFVERMFRWKTK